MSGHHRASGVLHDDSDSARCSGCDVRPAHPSRRRGRPPRSRRTAERAFGPRRVAVSVIEDVGQPSLEGASGGGTVRKKAQLCGGESGQVTEVAVHVCLVVVAACGRPVGQ